MIKNYIVLILIFFPILVFAQNTVITDDDSYESHNSAMLDVYSLTKGLLVPRLTSTQRLAIATPAVGLLVYDTDLDHYYYFANSSWNPIDAPSLWSENSDTIFIMGNGKRYGVGTASPVAKLTVQGDATIASDEPLFEVKNSAGDVIFAVYENEVKVNFKESSKGVKGGFAVGGITGTKADPIEYMRVTPDSVRIYINDAATKGNKGGFAVGGITGTKGAYDKYFIINEDSARIYLRDPAKGNKGGFAVGGITGTKGEGVNFLNLTQENYFIGFQGGLNILNGVYNSTLGYQSGVNLSDGSSNAFLGYQSGFNSTTGSGNLFLGYQSGFSNIEGDYNTFLGYKSGYGNFDGTNNTFLGSFTGISNLGGSYNTFIGDSVGISNTYGENNVFVGTKVGLNNTLGWSNAFIGNNAGYSNVGGSQNIFMGDFSGYSNQDAGMNIFIGIKSGYSSENGWNNVYLGTEAGYSNVNGSGNVFLGFQAGMNNANGTRNIYIGNRAGMDQQGSDKLIIDNRDADSTETFIWGDLDLDLLRLNARVGIGANPTNQNFLVGNSNGLATQSIMGVGDSFTYSQLKLEADIGSDTLSYMMVHDAAHRFRLFYFDGTDVFPRLSLDNTGKIMINSWADAVEMFQVNGTARFEKVGIGTYSNYQDLSVYNSSAPAIVNIMGVGNAFDYATLKLEADTGTDTLSYMQIHDKDHRYRVFYYDGNDLFPRLGIDTIGRVVIGNWSDGTEMLDVNGNARFRGVASEAYGFDLNITTDGVLTTSSSDKRLKENFRTIPSSLDKVLRLNGYLFDWKSGRKNDIGLVAQEVQKILPEVVFENPTDGMLGINYSRFPALFVEAFKDQQDLIEKQQAEIDNLKKRLENLEKLLNK
jgi:hypothetical protein